VVRESDEQTSAFGAGSPVSPFLVRASCRRIALTDLVDGWNHGLAFGQHEGGVDQRKVAEGLGEVAELPPEPRFVLFREQSDVIGE
jgi:hypothetical protein